MRKNEGYINIFQAAYILIVIGAGVWFQNLFKESFLWTSVLLFIVGGIGAALVIYLILHIIDIIYKKRKLPAK